MKNSLNRQRYAGILKEGKKTATGRKRERIEGEQTLDEIKGTVQEKKTAKEEMGLPREEQAEETASRRRRRADRYAAEENSARSEPAGGFFAARSSETAREVANRYRQREAGYSMERTARVPAQADRRPENASWEKMSRNPSGERIGYASGHMGAASRGRMSEVSRARLTEEGRNPVDRSSGSPSQDRGLDPLDARRYKGYDGKNGSLQNAENRSRYSEKPGRPVMTRKMETPHSGHKALIVAVVCLLVIGALIIGLLLLPEKADGPIGMLKQSLSNLFGGKNEEHQAVSNSITITGQDREEVPAQVDFAVVTDKSVTDVRLIDETGGVLLSDQMVYQRENDTLWELSWYAEEPYSGVIRLQTRISEVWMDTESAVEVKLLAPKTAEPSDLPEVVATQTPVLTPEQTPAQTPAPSLAEEEESFGNEEQESAGEGAEENADEGILEDPDEIGSEEQNPAEDADVAEDEDEILPEYELPENENPEEMIPEEAAGEDPAEKKTNETGEQETAQTERPRFTASASESASPSLITTTVVYNGTKKVAEYARADAEKIHMPVLGEYTKQKIGILTFRTDAFRQNASIGTVKGLDKLEIVWTADAGSIKGAGQTYYGIGWVGQPAIVKWSKEVREQSEMYDAKKEKEGLKEVIVAGLDGRIYFLDLSDGTATRNSVKLGYPMKGTPSVHPGGVPYMTVGQFARKMANGQGTIGLRQYNLYMLKELSLIDGMDAKNNRPYNKVGSFETSALIDRTVKSPVMVTAGTNGMLYLINLNGEFDYHAGTYTQSPTMVVMKSKAKGEKETSTAVEASVAMYDRYVYYADMGGFLRCVDTNTLTTVWAVALGDSVESTPALDWHGEEGLDLYTATLLSTRKKGDAEVKCFDALTGEERWTAAFGVKKDTKNKTVSGFRASPVVGQNELQDYIYYTVNNLSTEEQEKLGLGTETAALIALNKEDGRVAWSTGLSGRGYSSPVAVYDQDGNGAIIQCAGDGSILMLDGKTGEKRAALQIDGAIEASPAVYDGMMVIGTTEKNKNNIYGIRIH